MPKFQDLTRKKFGKLTVNGINHRRKYLTYWDCVCDCGKSCVVEGGNLRSGRQVSCGCHRLKNTIDRITKHGMTKTRIYTTWVEMRRRCNNVNDAAYQNYGGRGIKVCNEWNEFENFYNWALNTGYNDKLTIDRIDVNGDYETSNCKWSTMTEQGNNKRNNIIIEIDGEKHSIAEWSRILGIPYKTLYSRYYRKSKINWRSK